MSHSRDSYFDNLKAALILLVVFGHLIRPIHDIEEIVLLKRLIYVFHMPLFVFVSGIFAKSVFRNGVYRKEKIFYLLKAYVLFIVLIQLVYAVCGYRAFAKINFLKQSGAPWYLMAMILWYLTIPVICDLKPWKVISAALLASLLIGYSSQAGDFLSFSRTVVFSPFFYLGYFMTTGQVHRFTSGLWRIPGIGLGAVTGWFIYRNGERYSNQLALVYQNKSYAAVLEDPQYGVWVRLIILLMAAVMSWGLMCLIPSRRTFFSAVGQRTMTIFICHRIFKDVLQFHGLYKWLHTFPEEMIVLMMVILAVLLTGLFALKPFDFILSRLLGPWRDLLPGGRQGETF